MPKSPEEWLAVANKEAGIAAPDSDADALDENTSPGASSKGRGRLKIYLGFAAGVGKSYKMLEEANRRRERGQDVVIGFIETHSRAGTEAQVGDLETGAAPDYGISRRRVRGNGHRRDFEAAPANLYRG